MLSTGSSRAYQALTISERLDLYTKHEISADDFLPYEEWISIRGLLSDSHLDTMLHLTGMSRDDLNLALKTLSKEEEEAVTADVEQMPWRLLLVKVLSEFADTDECDILTHLDRDSPLDLTLSVAPFVSYSKRRISAATQRLCNIELSPEAVSGLLQSLAVSLLEMSIKTLVWELHRHKSGTDQWTAPGSDARYKDFLLSNFCRIDGFRQFYAEYPVIARRVVTRCDDVINHFEEMLTRLDEDYAEIRSTLMPSLAEGAVITRVETSQGDMHDQGRTVVILHFDNLRLVYKPKPLHVAQALERLIAYVNEHSGLLDLRTTRGLYRASYAFEEFIDATPCESEEEIKKFYGRFGQLCAIVYVLAGNDIHYENIVAASDHPVIVDTETIMHPCTFDFLDIPNNAFGVASRECVDSVAGTAMIPAPTLARKDAPGGIDISALSGDEQELPFMVLRVFDADSDNMHFEFGQAFKKGAHNIPSLGSRAIDFRDYRSEIVVGFTDCLEFLAADKDNQSGWAGLLQEFDGCQLRVILKATMNYARMMDFSSHPNYSSNMVLLERMFDNAWAYGYKDKRPVAHEVAAMLRGDIPVFSCRTDGRDLVTSDGTVLENFLTETPLDRVRGRVSSLDPVGIEKQRAQVLASLGMYDDVCQRQVQGMISWQDLAERRAYSVDGSEMSLLGEAERIADLLLDTAVVDTVGDSITWNNALPDHARGMRTIRPVDAALDSGLSGAMLFFHELAELTGEDRYFTALRRILNSLVLCPPQAGSLGLAKGTAGMIAALARVYKHRDGRDDLAPMNSVRSRAETLMEQEAMIQGQGFLEGVAGVMIALVEAFEVIQDQRLLDSAIRLSDRLPDANFAPGGEAEQFGLGHGALGQLFALRKLVQASQDSTVRRRLGCVEKHVARELSSFLEVAPDGIADGWCGAVIAVPELMTGQVKRLLRKVDESRLGDDSMLEGNAGAIFALGGLARAGWPDILEPVEARAERMVGRSRHFGRYAVAYLDAYPPVGLLQGLSGVGLALASLAARRGQA